MKSIWKRPGTYVSIITGILAILFIYELVKLNLLPTNILAAIVVATIIFWVLSAICLIKDHLKIAWRVIGWILAISLAVATGLGMQYANAGNTALEKVSVEKDEKTTDSIVSLYVLKDSQFKNLEDIKNHKIGILKNMGALGTDEYLEKLSDDGIKVETVEFDSSSNLAQSLKNKEIDGMILDSSYLEALNDMPATEKIEKEVTALNKMEYETPETNTAAKVESALDPFTIYISGIDTREDALLRSSRSDVNLLATVNPKTHELLLVSIPRDYYVETACEPEAGCMNGAMDKLTHTGLHGPETTEMTLENLFDIDINYNVRVNFNSLIKVVDELGGITVNNPNDFTVKSGTHFPVGKINLDGKKALEFVRERYSFSEGDRERGRNQMRVIEAIVDKATSPAIIKNFTGILKALSNSFQTNMSDAEIKNLIKAQLENPEKWTIYQYSVTGAGGTDFAAELGDNAYVMYPDEQTVKDAKADIDSVMKGQPVKYVNQQ